MTLREYELRSLLQERVFVAFAEVVFAEVVFMVGCVASVGTPGVDLASVGVSVGAASVATSVGAASVGVVMGDTASVGTAVVTGGASVVQPSVTFSRHLALLEVNEDSSYWSQLNTEESFRNC